MKTQNQWLFETPPISEGDRHTNPYTNPEYYGNPEWELPEAFPLSEEEWETVDKLEVPRRSVPQRPANVQVCRRQGGLVQPRQALNKLVNKPILRMGSRGTSVVELQQRLKLVGFPLVIDGIFGARTQAAVRSFQSTRGLIVDGIVGPRTWTALLNGGTPVVPSTCNPYQAEFERAAQTAGVPVSWASNPSLCQLVRHESSWNPAAKNPSSSAFGLFQFLTSTWRKNLPEVPYGTIDPFWQAVGGFRYIRAAYRTPDRAWAFWQATVYKNPSLAPPDLRRKAEEWISKGWGGY